MKKKTDGNSIPPGIRRMVPVAFLFCITLALYSYAEAIRAPWFGSLSSRHHQWLTGSTVKFAKNWYREGAWNLRFRMLENPNSIEFPTLHSRSPYVSYPPGTVLPIHILSLLSGQEPTPALVMRYNLANHFLIAFLLALVVYCHLHQLGMSMAGAFSLSVVPIFLELLLPGPLYWHQNAFFSDQAVILPVVLFLFLEVISGYGLGKNARRAVSLAQGAVLFFGVLTDWFMIVVSAVVYLKRLCFGEMGNGAREIAGKTAIFGFPATFALALFFIQLQSLGLIHALTEKFLLRSGINAAGGASVTDFYAQFWKQNFAWNYGTMGILLIWVSLAVFLVAVIYVVARRGKTFSIGEPVTKTVSLIGMVLIPCFLHNYFLKNHSVNHDFSALKFIVPLATVPFVLVPVLVAFMTGSAPRFLWMERRTTVPDSSGTVGDRRRGRKKNHGRSVIRARGPSWYLPGLTMMAVFVAAGFYIAKEHPRFRELFPPPEPQLSLLGDFLSSNSRYEDVVFSPYFEIPENPPQLLSYSMKRVHRINGIQDIAAKLRNVAGEYNVVLLLFGQGTGSGSAPIIGSFPGLSELLPWVSERSQQYNIHLLRIKKRDLAQAWNQSGM